MTEQTRHGDSPCAPKDYGKSAVVEGGSTSLQEGNQMASSHAPPTERIQVSYPAQDKKRKAQDTGGKSKQTTKKRARDLNWTPQETYFLIYVCNNLDSLLRENKQLVLTGAQTKWQRISEFLFAIYKVERCPGSCQGRYDTLLREFKKMPKSCQELPEWYEQMKIMEDAKAEKKNASKSVVATSTQDSLAPVVCSHQQTEDKESGLPNTFSNQHFNQRMSIALDQTVKLGLQTAMDESLDEMEKKHQVARDALRKEHQAVMDAKHQAAVDALGKEHQAAVDALGKEHQAAMDAKEKEHQAAVDVLGKEHQAAMDAKEKEHQAAMDAKEKEHQAALDAREKKHQEEVLAVSKEIEELKHKNSLLDNFSENAMIPDGDQSLGDWTNFENIYSVLMGPPYDSSSWVDERSVPELNASTEDVIRYFLNETTSS